MKKLLVFLLTLSVAMGVFADGQGETAPNRRLSIRR